MIKNNEKSNKILAVLLSIAVILSMMPTFVFQSSREVHAEEPSVLLIESFDETDLTVTIDKKGTLEEAQAQMPAALTGLSKDGVKHTIPVTWESGIDYESTGFEEYTFTAVLPDGIQANCPLPMLNLTVKYEDKDEDKAEGDKNEEEVSEDAEEEETGNNYPEAPDNLITEYIANNINADIADAVNKRAIADAKKLGVEIPKTKSLGVSDGISQTGHVIKMGETLVDVNRVYEGMKYSNLFQEDPEKPEAHENIIFGNYIDDVPLYQTKEYPNTYIAAPSSVKDGIKVYDYLAYTNNPVEPERVKSIKFDKETGLIYIPKTLYIAIDEENDNKVEEFEHEFAQVQILESIDIEKKTPVMIKIENENDEIDVIPSQTMHEKNALDITTNIQLVPEEQAELLDEDHIAVYVNGNVVPVKVGGDNGAAYYDNESGVLSVEKSPFSASEIRIVITKKAVTEKFADWLESLVSTDVFASARDNMKSLPDVYLPIDPETLKVGACFQYVAEVGRYNAIVKNMAKKNIKKWNAVEENTRKYCYHGAGDNSEDEYKAFTKIMINSRSKKTWISENAVLHQDGSNSAEITRHLGSEWREYFTHIFEMPQGKLTSKGGGNTADEITIRFPGGKSTDLYKAAWKGIRYDGTAYAGAYCGHIKSGLKEDDKYVDGDGFGSHGDQHIQMTILAVDKENGYVILGFLTPRNNHQSGCAIYKMKIPKVRDLNEEKTSSKTVKFSADAYKYDTAGNKLPLSGAKFKFELMEGSKVIQTKNDTTKDNGKTDKVEFSFKLSATKKSSTFKYLANGDDFPKAIRQYFKEKGYYMSKSAAKAAAKKDADEKADKALAKKVAKLEDGTYKVKATETNPPDNYVLSENTEQIFVYKGTTDTTFTFYDPVKEIEIPIKKMIQYKKADGSNDGPAVEAGAKGKGIVYAIYPASDQILKPNGAEDTTVVKGEAIGYVTLDANGKGTFTAENTDGKLYANENNAYEIREYSVPSALTQKYGIELDEQTVYTIDLSNYAGKLTDKTTKKITATPTGEGTETRVEDKVTNPELRIIKEKEVNETRSPEVGATFDIYKANSRGEKAGNSIETITTNSQGIASLNEIDGERIKYGTYIAVQTGKGNGAENTLLCEDIIMSITKQAIEDRISKGVEDPYLFEYPVTNYSNAKLLIEKMALKGDPGNYTRTPEPGATFKVSELDAAGNVVKVIKESIETGSNGKTEEIDVDPNTTYKVEMLNVSEEYKNFNKIAPKTVSVGADATQTIKFEGVDSEKAKLKVKKTKSELNGDTSVEQGAKFYIVNKTIARSVIGADKISESGKTRPLIAEELDAAEGAVYGTVITDEKGEAVLHFKDGTDLSDVESTLGVIQISGTYGYDMLDEIIGVDSTYVNDKGETVKYFTKKAVNEENNDYVVGQEGSDGSVVYESGFDESNSTLVYEFKADNPKPYGKVRFRKLARTGKNELSFEPDARFKIVNALDEEVETDLKMEGGWVTSGRLPVNMQYTIIQTAGNDLYEFMKQDVSFYLSAEDKYKTIDLDDIINEPKKVKLKVVKKDSEKETPVAGAVFTLIDTERNALISDTIATDQSGEAEIYVDYGSYMLYESKAPTGYIRNREKKAFTIDSSSELIQFDSDNKPFIKYEITDKPLYGNVTVNKDGNVLTNFGDTSIENKNKFVYEKGAVPGATYAVYALNDIYPSSIKNAEEYADVLVDRHSLEDTVLTEQSEDAVTSVMHVDTALVKDRDYTVDANNVVTLKRSYLETLEDGAYDFDVTYENGKTTNIAVTVINKAPIIEAGTLMSTAVTGENGKVKFLSMYDPETGENINNSADYTEEFPLGDYFMVETSAPYGYQLDTDKYEFTLSNDQGMYMTDSDEEKEKEFEDEDVDDKIVKTYTNLGATSSDDIQAILYRSGRLSIVGTGTMKSFASANDVPWVTDNNNRNVLELVIDDNVTLSSLAYLCYGCQSLENPPDVARFTEVTDMKYAFYGCESLTAAPNIKDLTNVTNMTSAFENCSNLRGTLEIDASPSSYANCLKDASIGIASLVVSGTGSNNAAIVATKGANSNITNE